MVDSRGSPPRRLKLRDRGLIASDRVSDLSLRELVSLANGDKLVEESLIFFGELHRKPVLWTRICEPKRLCQFVSRLHDMSLTSFFTIRKQSYSLCEAIHSSSRLPAVAISRFCRSWISSSEPDLRQNRRATMTPT